MIKIALDAGHGKYTAGKRCSKIVDPNETSEWFLNQRIASRVEELLKNYEGVETLRLDDVTGEVDVPLATRTKNANKWGADLCLSFHHNAGIKGGSGGGIVVFTYTTSTATERALQKLIYDECVSRGGLTGRATPLNNANFHMVREPKCDALLTEYGFMDSTRDTPIILTAEYAEKMAQGTLAAIVKHLGLKKKKEENEMTEADVKKLVSEAVKAARAEDAAKIEALTENLRKAENQLTELVKYNHVYHYYNQLPDYARDTIERLHRSGVFKGAGPDDMALTEDMMRILLVLVKAGVIK